VKPLPRIEGEVQRYQLGPDGDEWVKADDYAALNDYAALVQMERDSARAEVERLKQYEPLPNGVPVALYNARKEIERLKAREEAAQRLLVPVRTQKTGTAEHYMQWQKDCDTWLAGLSVPRTVVGECAF